MQASPAVRQTQTSPVAAWPANRMGRLELHNRIRRWNFEGNPEAKTHAARSWHKRLHAVAEPDCPTPGSNVVARRVIEFGQRDCRNSHSARNPRLHRLADNLRRVRYGNAVQVLTEGTNQDWSPET